MLETVTSFWTKWLCMLEHVFVKWFNDSCYIFQKVEAIVASWGKYNRINMGTWCNYYSVFISRQSTQRIDDKMEILVCCQTLQIYWCDFFVHLTCFTYAAYNFHIEKKIKPPVPVKGHPSDWCEKAQLVSRSRE